MNQPATKPILATRRQLRRAVREHFVSAYGRDLLSGDHTSQSEGMRFAVKCHGWTIETSFDFGRWAPEVTYAHSIWTGKLITKEEPAVLFANCIGFRLNYGNDIGIGSGWSEVTVENLDPVCTEIMRHCHHMLAAFPSLLEDLELERLSSRL